MNLIIFLVIAIVFLVFVEFLKRKFQLSASITRRLSHIGAALIAFISPIFITKDLIIITCLGFAITMYLSRQYSLFSSIHQVKRKTLGEVFLPLGEAVSAAIFLPQATLAFQYGVIVMGLSDAFAGFIGEKYGKHQINLFQNKKSLEGSLTFFFITAILTYIFAPTLGLHILFIPLALTIIELIFGYGTDNLVLPIFGALLFSYYI